MPLHDTFGRVYVDNLYRIASDVVNRPLAGVPGTVMKLRDRVTHDYGWTFELGFLILKISFWISAANEKK